MRVGDFLKLFSWLFLNLRIVINEKIDYLVSLIYVSIIDFFRNKYYYYYVILIHFVGGVWCGLL